MRKLKRYLAAGTAALLLCLPCGNMLTASAMAEPVNYCMGDGDDDRRVDVRDIIILQRYLLAVPSKSIYYMDRFDLNHDDVLDVFDLGLLKRVVIGMDEPEHVTEAPEPSGYIPPTIAEMSWGMPTYGNVKMLTVAVDFADVRYDESKLLSDDAIRESLYGNNTNDYPFDSLTNWYDRASYGALHVTGDVAHYTCYGNMADYMNYDSSGVQDYEPFVSEVLQGLDDQIDFRDYDSDHDGKIDCLSITVPADDLASQGEEYWWSSTSTWYRDYSFNLDGEYVSNYIILDYSPTADNMRRIKSTLTHEMGHAMGLTDYYLYGVDSHWESADGFEGEAGYERMDDSVGDFCAFSKLMLGWLQENEVMWFDPSKGNEQTFALNSISEMGSCVILPIDGEIGDYTTEYFVIEYVTPTMNNQQIKDYCWYHDSGVRIFHADAELFTNDWNTVYFRYDPLSPYYSCNGERRLLRLVNEGDTYASFGGQYTFYQPGDVCKYGVKNFAGYDYSDQATINTGYTVKIDEISGGRCYVTVSKK